MDKYITGGIAILTGIAITLIVINYQENRRIEIFKAFSDSMVKNVQEVQKAIPIERQEWTTIPPRSKEECIKESGGELNNYFIRCRNGRQELVKISENGRKTVLSERPIPNSIPK